MGVTFFSSKSPENFDTFCRAFVSMFRITIGRCWRAYAHCKHLDASPPLTIMYPLTKRHASTAGEQ